MAIYGTLDPVTKDLDNIGEREPGENDVEITAYPTVFGPWTYDSITKTAVQYPRSTVSGQMLGDLNVPATLMASIVLKQSSFYSSLPDDKKAQIQGLIDQHASRILVVMR